MGHNIDLLIGTVQRIAADLRPPLLDNLGLAAAIGWQVNEFTRRSGIECLTMLNEDADPSDPQTATTIVRIVQEALTNVIRHSEATEVCISLCRNDDGLLLEISDNGRGVSEQEIAARDSYGLIGMQERARICHGVLTVTGSPGCGTRLRLTIPIEKGATEL
jgi:signal transduction histidine kinase